jgi:hypothetical protein
MCLLVGCGHGKNEIFSIKISIDIDIPNLGCSKKGNLMNNPVKQNDTVKLIDSKL